MKRIIRYIAFLTICLSITNLVYSQCANDNTLWLDLTPASCPGSNSTSCIFGGEYCTVTVVSGNIYVFQTCGDTDFDTEITLYNQSAGTVITYDDDGCGDQSTITWTATFSGVVRVLVDKYPCASESSCMNLSVTCSLPGGSVYTHPTTGLQGTYLGACMVNTCGATYYDDGGAGGNYSNNVDDIYRTFCPSQPNTCVTATINSMNIDGVSGLGCYDYLWVLNGPTQNSPYSWVGCLTTGAPYTMGGTWSTTYTSTDASGCLGFRFTSNGSGRLAGWNASLSCTPCAGGPSATEDNNCTAAASVCGTTNVAGASTGPGLTSECNGCVVAENFTNWYKITVASNGTLALTINPNNNLEDYDFALYGPGVTCGALGSPIRCSYAAITASGSTGMGNGAVDLSETVAGDGWVSTLNVLAGETYFLMINGWSAVSSGFAIDWTGSTTTFGVPAGSVTVQTNSTCSGQSQGEACAVVNSGLPPYIYSWNTGPATSCLYNQSAGSYTVTVTDASLCTSVSSGTIASIATPAAPTASGTTICQGQTATLSATAPGGTYEWYNASSGGTLLQTGASYTTPALAATTTYYVQTTVSGCISTRTAVTVTVTPTPSATISYAGTPFCKSLATPQAVTLTGTGGGTFTAAPAGLSIVAGTGAITPSLSTAGTYTVTYSIAAGGGCSAFSTTTSVTITTLPVATFSYTGTPYCSNAANPSPTYSGGGVAGTFSSSGGLVFVSTATGQVNLATSTPGSYTVTNTIAAAGGCGVVTATSPITITALPAATISYAGTPFCTSVAAPQAVTQTGTAGGTYSAAPAGLTINSGTGAITPSSSTAGTYTVTYTIAAAGGCGVVTTTTSVTITALPTATISYAGTPFCKTVATPQAVTLTGTSGGSYTASPAGLSIVAGTGAITPSTSTAGTYTVTYTIAAAGGCGVVTTTTSVTITTLPVATFSYTGTPYCANASNPSPTYSGGGVAGTFSSTAGLVFVSTATGQVNLATSTPGTYTVTNTIAAAGGCAIVTATSPITITAVPSATISYAGTPFCKSVSTAQPVTQTGTTGGAYTASPAGLTINAGTGAITPSTSTAGTYTVTYTIAAAGGCGLFSTTTSVTITTLPVATFSYTGTPYCSNGANPLPTFSGGGVAGTFSSTAGLVFVSTATGQVNLAASTAGAYTVTNTIAAAGGCAIVTATSPITITAMPAATIAYAGTPFCTSVAAPQAVTLTGTSGGTYSSTAGLTINPATGAITPSTSTAGSYTVTYTIAAAGGCGVVTTTTSVTITALPTATISYTGTPFCKTAGPVAVNLTGTSGGTYSSTAGLTINSSTGTITPATSTAGTYTVTYTIAAAGGCGVVTATTSVTITALPVATFSYTGTPYCSNAANPSPTYSGGGVAGTFSSTAGLVFVSTATGQVNLAASTTGTYTVTNTIAAAGGCGVVTATSTITITALPTATISYGTPFCTSTTAAQPVTLTGTTGGTFSSTAGLTINAGTGAITPSTSTAGTYTVTYTIAAANGCGVVTATTSVTVNPSPTITSITPVNVTVCAGSDGKITIVAAGFAPLTYSINGGSNFFSNGGLFTGLVSGSYSVAVMNGYGCVTSGGSVNISDGGAPSAPVAGTNATYCQGAAMSNLTAATSAGGTLTWYSNPGLTVILGTGTSLAPLTTVGVTNYYVTETVAGCQSAPTIVTITITAQPAATISYAGTPFCKTLATPQSVTQTGTTGGTYTASPAGLTINASSGAITPSTSTAGTYTVTYTVAAAGGCSVYTTTTSVTITALPVATFSYTGTPYCSNAANPSPTYSGGGVAGTFSSTAGLVFVSTATGQVNLATSTPGTYTVTNTIAASGGCAIVTATSPITITALPAATISYAGTPFCSSNSTPQPVTITGTPGGTYSSTAGLFINSSSGAITPSTSTPGTYTVTYTIAAANGCGVVTTTASVTITTLPAATISYAGSPFCTSAGPGSVTLTGTSGGTYSSTAGLSINPATGAITPGTSTAGTYTVTYTIAAASGCGIVTATTPVTVTVLPTATISYGGTPFCSSNSTPQSVTLVGTSGGSYSSAAGLSINASTGAITPSTSTPGAYTVTYTIPAAGGCGIVTATTSVTVTALPTATISCAGSPFCSSASPGTVTLTGTTGGTYSVSPAGLSINSSTGAITPSTSTAGTYTVTYTIAAASGCGVVTATTTVTITALPTASISYSGNPFCSSNSTPQTVTLTGTSGGSYSVTPAGLTINSATGTITPSTSTPGAYTVTYTIAAANGCGVVTTTAPVNITLLPAATISYAGTPYCNSLSTSQAVTQTGTTGGTYSSTAGLTINPATGAITPSSSTAGTYTVTYTIAAASGCGVVTATTSVAITALPVATFSYTGSPYCSNASNPFPTYSGGGIAGTFSSTAGLAFINTASGQINMGASTPGTYTVTNTIPAANGCGIVTATSSITITALPTSVISYAGTPFCTSLSTPQPVTLVGTSGGTYTCTPPGLTINSVNGGITPSTSTAGTYTVIYTIAAASGCGVVTAMTDITISTLPAATISYTGTPFCSSVSAPQTVTITGSTGGSYSSAPAGLALNAINGSITPSASAPGTYTVSYAIPAANGCGIVTATASVTVTALPTATLSYAGNPFCNSVPNAPVTLTGTTGGSCLPAGLTINSSTGAITPTTSTPGTYTVTYTIAAASGCGIVTATTQVTINALPTANSTTPGIMCNGGFANISVTGTGGTPPYTGTGTFTNPVGTYSYIISDANSCTASTSITLTEPALLVASSTATSILCYGGSSTVTVTAVGGTLPYTGAGTFTQTAGTYSYTVSDLNGCASTTNITIGQPTQLVTTTSSTLAGCTLSDGSATVTASDGTGPYSYIWSPVGGTNATATNIPAGSYTVTTSDANNCSVVDNISVSNSGAPVVTSTQFDILCHGLSTGSIDLTVSGGTGAYSYNWNSGAFSSEDISGIPAGSYSYDVSDAANCHTTGTLNIIEPDSLIAASSATVIRCYGDTAAVTVTSIGGTGLVTGTGVFDVIAGAYTYYVTDANGCLDSTLITVSQPDTLIASTVSTNILCHGDTSYVTISAVGGVQPYFGVGTTPTLAGTYTYNVIDANGCYSPSTITITEPDSLVASSGATNILCYGGTADVTVSAIGGTGNYTGTGVFTVSAGTYTYTVTDDSGCVTTTTIIVSEPMEITSSVISTDAGCGLSDGTATVTASGGTGTLTYLWSPAGGTAATTTGLPAGNYSVEISDDNGCIHTDYASISNSGAPTSSTTQVDVLCNGSGTGSVDLTITGGTGSSTVSWNSGAYTTEDLTGIPAGVYSYIVTDDANCQSTGTVTINEPTAIVTSVSDTIPPLCNTSSDGEAVVAATGGTAPFTFLWSDVPATTDDTITTLAGGIIYYVTITDDNSCTALDSVTVVAPMPITLTDSITQATCGGSDGIIELTPSGGTAPYSYLWSNFLTSQVITGLASGNYLVTVTDFNGCSITGTYTIVNLNAGSIHLTNVTNTLCFGDTTGSITVGVTGGTPDFTYLWSTGDSIVSALPSMTLANLSPGTYSVTVIDANSCISDTIASVTGPTAGITPSVTVQDISCFGMSDGILIASATGGVSPFTYVWSNSQVGSTLTNLPAGTYSFTVTDANGCFTIDSGIVITEPEIIRVFSTPVSPICGGESTGSGSANATGGVPPYNFVWSNMMTTQNITNIPAGTYIVTVTDQSGCTGVSVMIVTQPSPIVVTYETGTDVTTHAGYIDITATGGGLPYTYFWSNNEITEDIYNLTGGWYTYLITDANTCEVSDSIFVELLLGIPNTITPNGDGINDDFFIINIEAYEKVEIQIYNQWDELLYTFSGTGVEYNQTGTRFDGLFTGRVLPMGAYLYIVTISNEETYTGALLIKY